MGVIGMTFPVSSVHHKAY